MQTAARCWWLGALLVLAPLPSCGEPADRELEVTRDVPYALRGETPLRVDIYREGDGVRPGVLVLHPGGWFSGNKRDVRHLASRLARAGYVAVTPGFRLSGAHKFPAQIHDIKEAVRWMRAQSGELGIDPTRIAAYGYSSGGHLAALLALSDVGDGLEGDSAFPDLSSRVQAFVAGGAPSDLLAMRANPAVSSLLGSSANEQPELAAGASPVNYASPDDPPGFLYHGRLDVLVYASQSEALASALAQQGVPVDVELGWLGHFSTFLFGGDKVDLAIAFLDRHLPAPAGPLAPATTARAFH